MKSKEEIEQFKKDIYKYIDDNFLLVLNGLYSVTVQVKETSDGIDPAKVFDYIEDNFDVTHLENFVEEMYQKWVDDNMKSIEEPEYDEGSKDRIFKYIDKQYRPKITIPDGVVTVIKIKNNREYKPDEIHKDIVGTYGLSHEETSMIIRLWMDMQEQEVIKRLGTQMCTSDDSANT